MALHGRDAELELVDQTLAAAREGRGQALFFTGEAGIGKSTLIAQARARASSTPAIVLAGAAWESGGAPPYWPWQQVLRDAADRFGESVRSLPSADRIAALVPEWGDVRVGPDVPDLGAARFALLDGIVRALVALSRTSPLVILLDDLHAADVPTLDVLALLARELPRGSIALIAAWRQGELATRADAADRLARASRQATVRQLRGLTASEVASWVGDNAAAIHASSEGNPLFVEELLRSKGSGVATHGIASVLEAHLALVGAGTRATLAAASVLGRELEPTLLRTVAAVGPFDGEDAIAAALREAATVGILEKRATCWAFRHVLLRDHLYDALPPSQRTALHRAVGEALLRVDAARAAPHLLAGIVSEQDVAPAISTARAAAARAMQVYAFEHAAELLAAALRVLEAAGSQELIEVLDVRLEHARALHAAGLGQAARDECVIAAELARVLGDAERLSRAAMIYASELLTGRRDPTMIGLLEEACATLPAADGATLARVTARLAAALVPTLDDHDRPQELAIAARAMALRIGDDETTMFVTRYCNHAHGFRMGVKEARDLAREVIVLSDRLGRPLEALEQRTWIVGAHLAQGDLAASDAALEEVEQLLARLPQPLYRYRLPILRASRATRRGELEEARRWLAVVRDMAREYDLDRARFAALFGELAALDAGRSAAHAAEIVDEVTRVMQGIGPIASGARAFVLALAGRDAEARLLLSNQIFQIPIVIAQFAADAVVQLRMTELAPVAITAMTRAAEFHPIANGPAGGLILRPASLVIGELLALVGRFDEAIEQVERGLVLARAIEAPLYVASGQATIARILEMRGKPPPPAARARDDGPMIACDGERAVVRWRGREIAVPMSKGIAYLATLVGSPRQEVHVSDLVGDEDRGDAGEVLDAKARGAYRERAEEIREALETARAHNDLGRIDALTAELESITDELVASTGLGGRVRKAGSRIERARVNVQRRIKDAIRRLAGEDEALGRYLDATVQTGTFCSFAPIDG